MKVGKSHAFGPTSRIKKRNEFFELQANCQKLYSKHFLILVGPSEKPESRLGLTITTKVEKRAVYRNKLKRRIREIFRQHRANFKRPFDMIVIARKNAPALLYEDIRREILGALSHAGYMTHDKRAPSKAKSKT